MMLRNGAVTLSTCGLSEIILATDLDVLPTDLLNRTRNDDDCCTLWDLELHHTSVERLPRKRYSLLIKFASFIAQPSVNLSRDCEVKI